MDSITVKGCKSFKDTTVHLRPINILIGSNGAGKSIFLSMFELLGNLVYLTACLIRADVCVYEGFLLISLMNVESKDFFEYEKD